MSLYVRTSGPATGAPVLFLHGGGLSGRMWDPVIAHLPDFYSIVPDLAGHGRSASIGPLAMDTTLDQLHAVIREHTPGGWAHVAGLSMGGAIAVTLMARAPDQVGQVIASGTARRLSRALAWLQNLNAPILRLMKPEQIAALMRQQFNIPPEHLPMLVEEARLMKPGAIVQMTQILRDIEYPAQGDSLLLVIGERETAIARRMARQYRDAIPGITVRSVAGLGHAWSVEQPMLFAQTVRAWVTASPLPDALHPLA